MGATQISLPVLADLMGMWESIPLALRLIGHSIFVAGLAPDFKSHWLVHYVVTFCSGFGGGTLSSLLIMDPKRAPIALFASNEVGVIWTVCWWLVTYFPGGLFHRVVTKWYIQVFTKACTSLLRAMLIIARVDLSAALFPGVVAAPLVLGTIAGCGGRIIVDAMRFGWGVMAGRAELSEPGFTSRSAFVAAAVYYAAAYRLQLLAPREAAGLVVTWLMVHSVLVEFVGHPLDFTEPIAHLAHTISFVPKPGAHTTPSKPGKKAAAAAAPAAPPASAATTPAKSKKGAPGGSGAGGEPQETPLSGLTKPQQRRGSARLAAARA